jgi:hypothetical protein
VKKLMAGTIAVTIILLAGCGARGPRLASSIQDIVGLWQPTSGAPFYILHLEDGTMHGSSDPDLVEDSPQMEEDFRFEGTKLFREQRRGRCGENPTSIDEVELLANGNLKFTAIEDECANRAANLEGAAGDKEWEPVP